MTAIEKELIVETLKEKFERDQRKEEMRKRQLLEGSLVDDNGNPVKRG